MSIYYPCPSCKTTFSIQKDQCKCGTPASSATSFRVIVKVNGKRLQRDIPRDLGGLAKAREVEWRLRDELYSKKFHLRSAAKEITLAEAFSIWFDDYKFRKDKKDDDYCAKREFWKFNTHIKNSELAAMKLNEITAGHVQKFIANVKDTKELSKQTIKHILGLISKVFNKMSDLDYYEGKNPAAKVSKSLGGVNNVKTNTLFENERNRLLEVLKGYPNQSVANLLKFLLFTGIRRGSAYKLRWQDVDFENRKIFLDTTKNGESFYLKICNSALDTLKDQIKYKSDKSDVVFPDDSGLQRKHHIPQFNYIKKLSGIDKPFRIHDLRHQFASELARKNVPLGVIQQLMGHKSMRMTERYSHFAPDNFNDALSKIDNAFGSGTHQQNTADIQTGHNSLDRTPETEKVQVEAQKQKETVPKSSNGSDNETKQPKTDNVIKFDFVNRKLA